MPNYGGNHPAKLITWFDFFAFSEKAHVSVGDLDVVTGDGGGGGVEGGQNGNSVSCCFCPFFCDQF